MNRIIGPKPVYGPPPSALGPNFPPYASKRTPSGAASSIAASYASAPSGPTITVEEQMVSLLDLNIGCDYVGTYEKYTDTSQ